MLVRVTLATLLMTQGPWVLSTDLSAKAGRQLITSGRAAHVYTCISEQADPTFDPRNALWYTQRKSFQKKTSPHNTVPCNRKFPHRSQHRCTRYVQDCQI
jgi:hypothetical protein